MDSSHSRHGLIVVDEPLCSDDQFRCVRDQVLFSKDRQWTIRDGLEKKKKNQPWNKQQVFKNFVLIHLCISADGGTDRLCSVTISGLRGSRNILGSDRIPPDGKPTVTKRSPSKNVNKACSHV